MLGSRVSTCLASMTNVLSNVLGLGCFAIGAIVLYTYRCQGLLVFPRQMNETPRDVLSTITPLGDPIHLLHPASNQFIMNSGLDST